MTKPDARDIAELFAKRGIRCLSGKWFFKNKEIKNIREYLMRSSPDIRSISMLDNVIDLLLIIANNPNGIYPDMPILSEAEHLTKLKPLAFPLNNKQLMLINYLLLHSKYNEEVAIIICGCGGSGKSTFLNIIKKIFDNDFASLNLEQLANPFERAAAFGKRLICSDELSANELNNPSIKQIISNQEMSFNPKYGHTFQGTIRAALIFSCNKPPKIDLSDTGLLRRFIFYEMNKKIEKPDPTLQNKEYTHEELVNIVAHALRINMANWKDYFKKETRKFLTENNNVWRFRKCTVYENYCSACYASNLKPYSAPKWQDLLDLFNEWEQEEALPDVP